MSSCSERTGSEGCATRISGLVAHSATAAKSFVRSGYVRFSMICDVISVCVVMSSTWPSGALFATRSPAIWLLAPGRFSTTTDWPRLSVRPGAICRAMMSVAPPGANPTSRRTGLEGYCVPCAVAAQLTIASARASAKRMRVSMSCLLGLSPFLGSDVRSQSLRLLRGFAELHLHQVADRHQPEQLALLDHRQVAKAALGHQPQRFVDRHRQPSEHEAAGHARLDRQLVEIAVAVGIQAHHVALGEDADGASLGVGHHHRADLLGVHGADRVGDARLGRHRDYAVAALGCEYVFQVHGRLPGWCASSILRLGAPNTYSRKPVCSRNRPHIGLNRRPVEESSGGSGSKFHWRTRC